MPLGVTRASTSHRFSGVAPTIASVTPWPTSQEIQQAFAFSIDMEKPKNVAAFFNQQCAMAADELVVCHAAISQGHRAPGFDMDPGSARKAGPEHHRIQEVAFKAEVLRYRTVVEGAG